MRARALHDESGESVRPGGPSDPAPAPGTDTHEAFHPVPACSPWRPDRFRPAPTGGWIVRWITATGSTNDDLIESAHAGAADRSVLVTDLQTAGRGRLGRSWQAPPGAALTFSVLLRPAGVPPARRGWIGALLGLAVVAGIRGRTGLDAGLKWPNDVLIGDRKVAGVLAASTGTAVVVGAGINVSLAAPDLPRADATSLLLSGADAEALGREELLAAVLDALAPLLDRWAAAGGDMQSAGLRADYLARCATIGRAVTIQLPDADPVTGTAVDVTADGAIVIETAGMRRRFSAGDVLHLRAAGPVLSDQ